MHTTPTELIGPDFLQKLSEQQLAAGLETDFTVLQANARAWNAERATLTERDHTIVQQDRELRTLRDQVRAIGTAAQQAVAA